MQGDLQAKAWEAPAPGRDGPCARARGLADGRAAAAGVGGARASRSFLDSITITTPWVLAILGTAGALLLVGAVSLLVVCWPRRRPADRPKGAAMGRVRPAGAPPAVLVVDRLSQAALGCLPAAADACPGAQRDVEAPGTLRPLPSQGDAPAGGLWHQGSRQWLVAGLQHSDEAR